MSRKSGSRFSDNDMRQQMKSRARPDSNGTGRALATPVKTKNRADASSTHELDPQPLTHGMRIRRCPHQIESVRIDFIDHLAGGAAEHRIVQEPLSPALIQEISRNGDRIAPMDKVFG